MKLNNIHNDNLPLCKNCKHKGKSSGYNNCCLRPIGTNLYDGTVLPVNTYCNNERSTGKFWSFVLDMCGKQGRYFEEDTSKVCDKEFLWCRDVVSTRSPKPDDIKGE